MFVNDIRKLNRIGEEKMVHMVWIHRIVRSRKSCQSPDGSMDGNHTFLGCCFLFEVNASHRCSRSWEAVFSHLTQTWRSIVLEQISTISFQVCKWSRFSPSTYLSSKLSLKMNQPVLRREGILRLHWIDTSTSFSSVHTMTNGRKSGGGHDRQIMRSLCTHDFSLFVLHNR